MHACMQEEAQEYVQEQKLRDLVNQYSEFINFPIYMYTSKQVSLNCSCFSPIAPRRTPVNHCTLSCGCRDAF